MEETRKTCQTCLLECVCQHAMEEPLECKYWMLRPTCQNCTMRAFCGTTTDDGYCAAHRPMPERGGH